MTPVTPETLDVGYLALFVGQAMNARILEGMTKAGFEALRPTHGYVVQHLIDGPRPIGELAEFLGVTQQGASKIVKELESAGYLEAIPSDDARVRLIGLSARGKKCVTLSRTLRRETEAMLVKKCGARALAQAKAVLVDALDALGGSEDVRHRRVPLPK